MGELKSINSRIRFVFAKSKMKQKEFADSLGISTSYVSGIVNLKLEDKTPSDTLLLLMSHLFGVSFQWLKFGTGALENRKVWHVGEDYAAYGEDQEEIKNLICKLEYIYLKGTEEQKALVLGHINRVYNRMRPEKSEKHSDKPEHNGHTTGD